VTIHLVSRARRLHSVRRSQNSATEQVLHVDSWNGLSAHVCVSVCVLGNGTFVSCAKMAKPTDMPYGLRCNVHVCRLVWTKGVTGPCIQRSRFVWEGTTLRWGHASAGPYGEIQRLGWCRWTVLMAHPLVHSNQTLLNDGDQIKYSSCPEHQGQNLISTTEKRGLIFTENSERPHFHLRQGTTGQNCTDGIIASTRLLTLIQKTSRKSFRVGSLGWCRTVPDVACWSVRTAESRRLAANA